jgi:hypothetical protein
MQNDLLTADAPPGSLDPVVMPQRTRFDGRVETGKDEWLTPPEIVKALGPFDLDPCAPIKRPWPTAANHYTIEDNGLIKPWHGRVWLNPPYGTETGKWMRRMKEHGNGIVLIFARTETQTFFECVWGVATACLWLKGRLTFYNVDGTKPKYSGGAPSVLIAYGQHNADRLRTCELAGRVTAA